MSYFTYFPTILNSSGSLLTDITIRTKIKDSWLNNNRLYYSYEYQDHDRIEDIAFKMYGDQGLGWIILYSNNILNPNFDLPLSSKMFELYLNDKYGNMEEGKTGVEYALSTIDPKVGYQKQITYEYATKTVTEYYPVDETEFNKIEPFNKTILDPVDNSPIQYTLKGRLPLISIYDNEFSVNESKRTIKILKKEYINQAKTELRKILNK